jgi:hypothetical protein
LGDSLMTDSGQGGTIAATFTDKSSAEACLADLKASDFTSLWMAVTPSTAAGRPEHVIAESSDGPLGRLGRFLTGAHSLRQTLVEHGVADDEAERTDASLALGGAVIVVDPGDRAELATEIVRRGASRVLAPGRDIGGRYPSTTDTVPGQADELDRGSGNGASGGGLGATTGFMDESAARKDLRANGIGALEP